MIPALLSSEQIAEALGCDGCEVEKMADRNGWESVPIEYVEEAITILQETKQSLEQGAQPLLVWLEIIRKSGASIPPNFSAYFEGQTCTIKKIVQVAKAHKWGNKKDRAAIRHILSEVHHDAAHGRPWFALCVDVLRMCGFPLPEDVDVWIEVVRRANIITFKD
jgi:hypothetical protein